MSPARQPVAYVPHGGGPWPFVPLPGFLSDAEVQSLKAFFEALPKTLPAPPKALLVVSAHWEEDEPTVMTSPQPPILYDYYGFPPESYAIPWPAPGAPALAQRVLALLREADFHPREDSRRGFDHGTFIPFKVSWPNAELPTIQLSLRAGLEPAEHLAMGRALAPLRDEGVLILGSGMSFHNMRGFGNPSAHEASLAFDAWLHETVRAEPKVREQRLAQWTAAPAARAVHPREEHLLPLMVVAGAAGGDVGRVTFSEDWARVRISAFQFG
jgi:aromatic ring-opening dioxygenase catalytic subunit (LigB family)